MYEKPYEVRQVLPKSRRVIWKLSMDLLSDAKRHYDNTDGGVVQLLYNGKIIREKWALVPPAIMGPAGPYAHGRPLEWQNVEFSKLWQKRYNPDNEPMRFPKPRNLVYKMQKAANIRQTM